MSYCRMELCGCKLFTTIRMSLLWDFTILAGSFLFQDVQLEVDGNNLFRKKAQFHWLNGDVCDRNTPNCILTRVLGFTVEGSSIPLTFEGNNRFCRLANGDLDDEDVGDDEDQTPEDERAAGESEREVSLPRLAGVSLSGRRTTLFQLW